MHIETYGQQLEITPALREYVETKFQRLARHFGHHCEVRTQLSIDRLEHQAVATVNLPGRTLHADASASTMYAAIDLLADKLDRLVIKYKEKHLPHASHALRDNG